MTRQDMALAYLEHFCAGEVQALAPLLASDLNFAGPLHSFGSAADYLSALADDPPPAGRLKVLSVTENSDSVAVFYEYHKPEVVLTLAQLFRFSDKRIKDILLVF